MRLRKALINLIRPPKDAISIRPDVQLHCISKQLVIGLILRGIGTSKERQHSYGLCLESVAANSDFILATTKETLYVNFRG